MAHQYKRFELADGGYKVVQITSHGTVFQRDEDYPDYLLALGDGRVDTIWYSPPSLYEQQQERVIQTKHRTAEMLSVGVGWKEYKEIMKSESLLLDQIEACRCAAELTAVEDAR